MATKRVLCFPGFLQSGKLFAEKSSGIRKLLTKQLGFELDYIDPPELIQTKEELPFILGLTEEESSTKWGEVVSNNCNRCWWKANEPGVYDGFNTSMDYVVDYIKKNGPFDGIIGFSQGAAMAAMVSNSIHRLIPDHPYFDFSLLISGFVFIDPLNDTQENRVNINYQIEDLQEYISKVKIVSGYEQYFDVPADFKTSVLVVYGTNDNTVPPIRSLYLSSLYKNNIHMFEHDGGHFIPNKKPFLRPIVELLKETTLKSNL